MNIFKKIKLYLWRRKNKGLFIRVHGVYEFLKISDVFGYKRHSAADLFHKESLSMGYWVYISVGKNFAFNEMALKDRKYIDYKQFNEIFKL